MSCVFRQVRPLIFLSGALTLAFGEPVSVEKQAGKILQAKCLACHGQTRMADLDLRESSTTLKGGKRGSGDRSRQGRGEPAVQGRKREGELQMPPGKTALTAAEVDACATGSTPAHELEAATEELPTPSWWSFRKPVRPAVPAVKDASLDPQSNRRLYSREARAEGPAAWPRRRTAARWLAAPTSICTACRLRRSRWTSSSMTSRPMPTRS